MNQAFENKNSKSNNQDHEPTHNRTYRDGRFNDLLLPSESKTEG